MYAARNGHKPHILALRAVTPLKRQTRVVSVSGTGQALNDDPRRLMGEDAGAGDHSLCSECTEDVDRLAVLVRSYDVAFCGSRKVKTFTVTQLQGQAGPLPPSSTYGKASPP